ncbi:hypothetical protein [Plantactinospora endophytica]|uniref:DUF3618 domain-containing protein n=1 Tax=Plantactinospora endophytica TaxID=673535 RepID=A0ABQ4E6G5_9ACTN|nr:hypothetical protein [Plantactinospora endophytica]GIG90297.1 hypothetical protein Pen02_52330 [Plantactinospora endophytica]
MLGTNLLKHQSKPERVADQAWEYLTSTVNSAGDSVKHAARDTARSARRTGSHLTSHAGDRMSAVTDEARVRASLAYDALAGRRPGLPWAWLVGAGLVGAALAWAATTASRAALARAERELPASDRMEFVDVDRANSPVRLDTT